jgi:hypothetical protein
MLFTASLVHADPTVFKMQLGQTTEAELKKMYKVSHEGTNKYSFGNMYSVPTSSIDFEGLQEVTAIFNEQGVLVAVLTKLPKRKFDYLNSALSGKYKLVNKNIPFVGNKSVKYADGNTEITLDAPHMSFDMSMNYITQELLDRFNKISEAESAKKRSNEASQL